MSEPDEFNLRALIREVNDAIEGERTLTKVVQEVANRITPHTQHAALMQALPFAVRQVVQEPRRSTHIDVDSAQTAETSKHSPAR